MAITRIGQSGFELNDLSEVPAFNPGSTHATFGGTAFTGSRTITWTTVQDGGRGFDCNTSELRSACMIFVDGLSAGAGRTAVVFYLRSGGGSNHIEVLYDVDTDQYQLRIGGSVVDSVARVGCPLDPLEIWHDVGISVKVDAASGWVRFYAKGAVMLSFDGNTGSDPLTAVIIGGASPGDNCAWNFVRMDDFYADDCTGEGSPSYPPLVRFDFVVADNNGADSEWSGSDGDSVDNYLMVDDGAIHDADSTYVFAEAAALSDLYVPETVVGQAGYTIEAVIPAIVTRRTDGGVASTIKLQISKGGVSQSGDLTMPTTYGVLSHRFTALPDASELTPANINLMEFGYESSGVYV